MSAARELMSSSPPGMSPTGCLTLLWPRVAECLVTNPVRTEIETKAALLPPVPRLALELRLGDGEDKVDLHQLFVRDQSDCTILARYADRLEPAAVGNSAVRWFLKAWACGDDAELHAIDRVFLEWDALRDQAFSAAPALFLPVDLRADTPLERRRRRQVLSSVFSRLCSEGGGAMLARTLDDSLRGASISHIGIMSGRGNAVRVNYRGVASGKLTGFLHDLEWPGDIPLAAGHFDALVELSDRVTVALDFREYLLPSIGFEVFLDHPLGVGARWSRVFDYFQQHATCTQAKREALCNVRGCIRSYADTLDWPAPWIIATVRASPDVNPFFRTDVSHLKLTLGVDGHLCAKAYITGQHFWRDPPPTPRTLGELPRRSASITETQVRAVRFLRRARQQNGLWGDFNGFNGGSSTYATALAGSALARCGSADARELAKNIVPDVLRQQRLDGGWGHNEAAPVDSDDTASVLKFLQAVGFEGPQVGRALAFLREHHLADGGFTAYDRKTAIAFAAGKQATHNWRTGHLCVAANCAALLGDALLPLLSNSQNADGSWSPFWWRTPAYATALAAEALAGGGASDNVTAAVRWANAQNPAIQTVFDATCIVRILCLGEITDRKAAHALLGRICEAQLDDGSWLTGAEMVVPRPDGAKTDSPWLVVPDDQRVFTTAAVLAAITASRIAEST